MRITQNKGIAYNTGVRHMDSLDEQIVKVKEAEGLTMKDVVPQIKVLGMTIVY